MANKCADCGEPIYKGADGKYATDRRAKEGAAPEGKERRADFIAKAEADKKKDTKQETPPRREHFLHRQLWGSKKA